MTASASLGYGHMWAVESRSTEGRIYLVARLQDGQWVCSGQTLPDHCGPDKTCWHIKERQAEWEAGRRELTLVPGGAA